MWVTGKEIEEAKKHDLLSYLKIADPFELKRFSHDTWCLRSHDSFKISNGLWHWFSRGIGGRSAVDYLIKVKGYPFQMAVKEVNKVMNIEKSQDMRIPEEKKEFRLFVKSPESGKVIRYLTGRGIDCKIVHELIDEGLIYEAAKDHSVIFVGLDETGVPAHASYRTTSGNRKGDIRGSRKEYAFRIERKTAETVRVFESAIDLLSYMTLRRMQEKEYEGESLISTAGVSAAEADSEGRIPAALRRYLEAHPETKTVALHFDNDRTGRRAAEQAEKFLEGRYSVEINRAEEGKDYNEYLMAVKGADKMEERTTIEVIMVEPGERAVIRVMDDSLGAMQAAVGGLIEEYMPFEDEVALICNEEGKMNGMPLNRAIYGEDGQIMDVIAGPFFIAYAPVESENFLSLPDDLKQKYMDRFRAPEKFFMTAGGIRAVPLRQERVDHER